MEFGYVFFYFSALFFINALVQFLLYILIKKPFHLWSFFTLLFCGYVFFYRYAFYSGLLKEYTFLAGTTLNTQLASIVAPFMLISIIEPNFKTSWRHFFLFLPAFIGEFRLGFLQFDPDFRYKTIEDSIRMQSPDFVPDVIVNFLYGINMLLMFAYVIAYFSRKLNWKNIWLNLLKGGATYRITAYIFLTNFIHILILSTTIPAMNSLYPEKLIYYANFIFPGETFLFFVSIQFLPFLISHQMKVFNLNEGARQTFVRSRLDGINLDDLDNRCSNLLEKDELYLDENLSLESFSKKADYHPKVVSEYLNSIKKVRFNDYINQYRLKKAIELLNTDPEIGVTRAALDAGFNSIPTFYRLFKKQTGTSPEKYRSDKIIRIK